MFLIFISLLFQSFSQDPTVFKASDKVSYIIKDKIQRPADLLFFTEGLSFFSDDVLLESTGLYGDSEIHYVDNVFDKKKIELKLRQPIGKQYFGEGCSKIKNKNGKDEIYMLTWKERKAFQLDSNLQLVKELEIPGEIQEGWGMTSYRNNEGDAMLLISDGTNRLYHVDPSDFKVKKTVSVRLGNGEALNKLNELEIIGDGTVLANIYETPLIAQIDPHDGKLMDVLDFTALIQDVESVKGKGYTDPMFNKVWQSHIKRQIMALFLLN
ncbi:unnamed protein product (macronuclear) [Paramecium tetraurelia]|uniref:Glutamine cyclotransferase n=1 Tax=Paramecium tetraurelia TaxID=5888 RepID=A0CV59_PARTE|nr:uncharacterized protein GSPATT00010844001 [Paramecium tetraurelia]CAK74676.1 unnamed protein product [Paramecium tetraurelia]|eukprot:XP_001442073.1 hypothetical protein (macronuclear) [Paramecium tetraurelia strain d4-2]